jgi:hypothetical protein
MTLTRRYATLFTVSALALAGAPHAPAFTGPSTPSQDQPSQSLPSQDLRSPDARDAATASGPSPVAVSSGHDLRSPDTRDAASGYDPKPVAVAVPKPSGSGEGFDWVSAAIGGAAVGGLILLLVGFMNGRGGHGVGRIGGRGALHA